MLNANRFEGIYFYEGIIDFRKQIDGLAALVSQVLVKDPYSKCLFVFLSRDRRKIKALYWDHSGYALWTKRLERERFSIQRSRNDRTVEINREQLEWFLSGMDWWRIKRHNPIYFEKSA